MALATVVLAALIARQNPGLARAFDQLAVTVAGGLILLAALALWTAERARSTDGHETAIARISVTSSQRALITAGVALIVINGAIPYLGGRTQTSFTMFSNLRTETEANHLLLGRADILTTQEDLVMLTAASHGEFESLIGDDLVVPTVEIARILADLGDDRVTLTVLVDGERVELDDQAARARFPAPSRLGQRFSHRSTRRV